MDGRVVLHHRLHAICRVRAAIGHAAAAPPITLMKSRRRIAFTKLRTNHAIKTGNCKWNFFTDTTELREYPLLGVIRFPFLIGRQACRQRLQSRGEAATSCDTDRQSLCDWCTATI
jgi:hypothetical protein